MPPKSSPGSHSFEDLLARASEDTQKALREGLPLLSRLGRAELAVLATLAVEALEAPHAFEGLGAPEKLGLPEEDSIKVLLAGSFLSASSQAKESPGEVSEILQKKFSLSPGDLPALVTLLEMFQDNAKGISEAFERRNLSLTILPSFMNFNSAVDIRFKLVEGQLSTFVPVAVAYLDTDAPNGRYWFQLSKEQIQRLLKKLVSTLREMEETEKWVAEHTRK